MRSSECGVRNGKPRTVSALRASPGWNGRALARMGMGIGDWGFGPLIALVLQMFFLVGWGKEGFRWGRMELCLEVAWWGSSA